jgi:hypothetical protein
MTVSVRTALSAVCFLMLSALTTLHAQDRLHAGNWENTVTSADGKTMTRNACMSAEIAAKSNGSPAMIRAETEKAIAKSGACQLKEFSLDNKSKIDTMVCSGDTIHNETTFHGGDSFETTTTRTHGGVVTVAHFKGRRTGECKPGSDD